MRRVVRDVEGEREAREAEHGVAGGQRQERIAERAEDGGVAGRGDRGEDQRLAPDIAGRESAAAVRGEITGSLLLDLRKERPLAPLVEADV